MQIKLADEQCYQRELYSEKARIKRKLADIAGNNSRTYRKVIEELREVARRTKHETTAKMKAKNEHLKKKYNIKSQEQQEPPPEDLKKFEDIMIFDKTKYENLKNDSYQIKIIGNVELSNDEKAVLRLHPKFCVLENLTLTRLEQKQKAVMAMLRMEISKQQKNKEFNGKEIHRKSENETRGASSLK